MHGKRAFGIAAFCGVAGVVALASVAWACVEVSGPYLERLQPERGGAATTVSVAGGNWDHGSVSLRWGSAGGQQLTTAVTSGGRFSANITVPNVSPSVYQVVAVQGGTTRATPFEVVAATKVSSDAGTAGAGTGGTTSGSTSAGDDDTSTSSGTAAATGVDNGATGIPARSEQRALEPSPQPADQLVASPPAGMAPALGSPQRAGGPAPVAADRRQSVATPGTPGAAAERQAEDATVPSAGSAVGDLWSGVSDGPSPMVSGLTDLEAERSTSPVAVGVGIAVLASVALLGGFGAAELRRRRVTVNETTNS